MKWFNRFDKHAINPLLVAVLSTSLLIGCSGGSDDDIPVPADPPFDEEPTPISGAAVKGPILNGTVTVYDIDTQAPNFKGRVVASGVTDGTASFRDVIIPLDEIRLTPAFDGATYLIEITGGTSLTTSVAPVIATQRVLISGAEIISEEPIYATPLTTLAYQLTLNRFETILATSTNKNPDRALRQAHEAALNAVKAAFGFGLLPLDNPNTAVNEGFDIRYTSPMQTNDDALAYRTAIESFAAIVDNLRQALVANGVNIDNLAVIELLGDDLSDGAVDGEGSNGSITGLAALESIDALLPIITVDPETLTIPGTARPITEINVVLQDELATVAPEQTPSSLDPLAAILPAAGNAGEALGDPFTGDCSTVECGEERNICYDIEYAREVYAVDSSLVYPWLWGGTVQDVRDGGPLLALDTWNTLPYFVATRGSMNTAEQVVVVPPFAVTLSVFQENGNNIPAGEPHNRPDNADAMKVYSNVDVAYFIDISDPNVITGTVTTNNCEDRSEILGPANVGCSSLADDQGGPLRGDPSNPIIFPNRNPEMVVNDGILDFEITTTVDIGIGSDLSTLRFTGTAIPSTVFCSSFWSSQEQEE